VLDLTQIRSQRLTTEPYEWALVSNLFSSGDGAALAESYPRDHFKTVRGYGGEKDYEYEARSLIHMGSQRTSHEAQLSAAWLAFAEDLKTPAYRSALTQLTGVDLRTLPMEANVFHYGPRSLLGPHTDLADKVLTQVIYFNQTWDPTDGGCLHILRSSSMSDVAAIVPPLVGTSAVLVRSKRSWHAVSRVAHDCGGTRKSMTVTFYRPGSVSSMWPPGEAR
jgi:SM-20-related protein